MKILRQSLLFVFWRPFFEMTLAESNGLGRRHYVIKSAPYHQKPYISIGTPCSGQLHSLFAATLITCKVPVCEEVTPSIQLQLPVWCQGLEVQTPTARFVSPFEGAVKRTERLVFSLWNDGKLFAVGGDVSQRRKHPQNL